MASGICEISGCSATSTCERDDREDNGRGGCGLLRDEIEWGLECESETGFRVEAAAAGVARGQVSFAKAEERCAFRRRTAVVLAGAGPVTKLWPDILFRARSLEIRRHIGTDVENDCLRSELGAMR